MINTINSDLIRGHIDTIILSVLHEGDRYGYDILGEIEKKSGGQYVLKQPTLYSCLKRLETQGFIYKYWGTETAGGRRTYYSLTEMGKELFLKNKDEWKYSRGVIDRLISTTDDQIESGTVFVEVAADVPEQNGVAVQAEAIVSPAEIPEDTVTENTTGAEAEPSKYIEKSFETERINEAYINVLSEAEKEEIINASGTVYSDLQESPAIESYFSEPVIGYSYADRLAHEQPDTKKKEEDELLVSSYFAKDVSDEDDEEQYADEDDYSGQYAEESEESVDESYYNADVNTRITDKPFYTDNDFKEADDESGRQMTMFDLIEDDAREVRRAERPEEVNTLFKRYDSAELSEETDREMVVGREYRNVIKQLLTGDLDADTYYSDLQNIGHNSDTQSEVAATKSRPDADEGVYDGDVVFLDTAASRPKSGDDFDNLLKSVRSMGDEIRIRTHNGDIDKEYNSLYHYYSNKLLLFKYGILFGLMILEIMIPYFIIKFGLGIAPIVGELPVLVISVVGAALLPAYAISSYLIDPYRRKRYDFDIKSSLLYRLGIMLLMLILVYAVNVVFYMDISFEAEYAFSLVTPALLSTNIPLSGILFKSLYDSKKFGAE